MEFGSYFRRITTFGEGETDVKKTIATQNLVGRIGTPEEIASAVALAQFARCGVHHWPGHHCGWAKRPFSLAAARSLRFDYVRPHGAQHPVSFRARLQLAGITII